MCSPCAVCQKTWLPYPNTLLLLLSWRPYYLGLPLKHGCWPQSTQVESEIQRFASVLTAGQISPKLGRFQHRVLSQPVPSPQHLLPPQRHMQSLAVCKVLITYISSWHKPAR